MSYEVQEVFFNPNKESVAVSLNDHKDIKYYVYDYLSDSGFFNRDHGYYEDELSDDIELLADSFYFYSDLNGRYGYYYHYKKSDIDEKFSL